MALAPLSGSAFGQDMVVPPAYMPGAYQPQGFAPVGYAGPAGPVDPAGFAGAGGYVTPAAAEGPMAAPAPIGMGGGPVGIAMPSGSVFTPRLVTSGGYGDGLGWDEGYQSIGAWVPIGLNDDSQVIYLDARGFGSFTEGGGGNFNVGYRHYVPGMDRFFGAYGGFDIDAGNANSHDFSRFVVGAESVGKFLTYRANGYVPVGDESHVLSSGQFGNPFFRENNIIFTDRTVTRIQYGGVDGEIGGPLPLVGKYGLSGFAGGYWVSSDADDAVGFKGRLEANINDDLQIGGKLTHDEIFDTNVWVTMTLRSPKGSWADFFRRDWFRQPKVQTQMDRSPEREYRIATDVKTVDEDVLALDPTDGLPFVVLHVDPNAGAGSGTFENPTNVIQGANTPVYDIVYVRPGTIVTGGPVTLFDNQRLLSTAVPHLFDTQRGTFTLPGFTGGSLPLLRNSETTESAVILLADNNEVSGFQIDGVGTADPITLDPTFHTGISGPGVTSFNVNRDLFTNVTSGAVISHVGVGTGVFNLNTITGNGFGSSLGASLGASGGATLQLTASGNTVSGFLGEDADASGTLSAAEDINNNGTLDPGIGINILANGGSTIDVRADNNVLTGNATGMRVASLGGSSVDLEAFGNTVGQNTQAGVVVESSASAATAGFVANQFVGNLGPALNGVGTAGGSLLLTAGTDLLTSGNLFDANTGAAITMTLSSGSTGRLFVRNNTISNTEDDLDSFTRFNGEGIAVYATGTAALTEGFINGNLITGNDGDGILVAADTLATVNNLVIGNLDGDNNNGNQITNQGRVVNGALTDASSGIRFVRSGNARFDFVQVVDNEIFENTLHGIDFQVDGGLADVFDVVVAQNSISGNAVDGVSGIVGADGVVSIDLRRNLISVNGNDGVSFQQDRFTIDNGAVTGIWAENLITQNGDNGIDISAPMADLQVGTTDLGNVITRNGRAGILLDGPGSATFTTNLISLNGATLNTDAGVTADQVNTFGAGVDIQGVGAKTLVFVTNRISDNFGDGVEVASINNGFFTFDVNFTDNVVRNNLGRGYDILNTGDGRLIMTIQGTAAGRSVIEGNVQEGVYVVNTASNAQTQQGATPVGGSENTDPTHGMDATGAVDAQTFMAFNFTGNNVIGNGAAATELPSKGLVIRVGTTGGGYGFTQTGGFAGDGAAGIIATVNNNFFSGNTGADFYVESFTSTVAPATGTTWTATEFNPAGYQGDPLARLDLAFEGNTFDAIDVNNTGAFYNNADGVFKSRTQASPTTPEDGPFSSATRRRNAQRLASRDGQDPTGTPNPPGEPFEFEYPGLGESTFRITQQTATDIGFFNAIILNNTFFPQPFLLDNQPFTNSFDANGVLYSDFITGGDVIFGGELPFGWSLVP